MAQITLSERTAKRVLNDLAALDLCTRNSKADSAMIVGLATAYHYKDSALQEAVKAYNESNRIGQDWHKMYSVSEVQAGVYRKAYRKQKLLKWLAVAGMGLVCVGVALN